MTNPYQAPQATLAPKARPPWRECAWIANHFAATGAVAALPLWMLFARNGTRGTGGAPLLGAGVWLLTIGCAWLAGVVCWRLRGDQPLAEVAGMVPWLTVVLLWVPVGVAGSLERISHVFTGKPGPGLMAILSLAPMLVAALPVAIPMGIATRYWLRSKGVT